MRLRFFQLLLFCLLLAGLSGCAGSSTNGRGASIATTPADENLLGEAAFRQVLQKRRFSSNEHWRALLQRVSDRLAKAAEVPDARWEFRLVEGREQNAICLPGGKCAYFTGLIAASLNEAGVAAVLAHLIGHVSARHFGQRLTIAIGASAGYGGVPAMLDSSNRGRQAVLGALGLDAGLGTVLPFSAEQEAEADALALQLMARAGYDPAASAPVWEHFTRLGGNAPALLSLHPVSGERLQAMRGQEKENAGAYHRSARYGLGSGL